MRDSQIGLGTIFRTCMICIATFLALLVASYVGNANAQPVPNPNVCADIPPGSPDPVLCTKEIRIVNNTEATIYVVLQGSIQQQAALGTCPITSSGGGGDVWLQRALNDTAHCHPVNYNYYVYVNPQTGIGVGETASITVPWWSKPSNAPDPYIDWWRAGRVYLFDDQVALNDSYSIAKTTPLLQFPVGSPVPSCKANTSCQKLEIYQVTPGNVATDATIGTQSPFQLNEYTFADVTDPFVITPTCPTGGCLVDLNQNYNVSNVDQVYLPLAMEPIRAPTYPTNIGYMGTIMNVTNFRTQLELFTGTGQYSPQKWPIYNNPQNKYPKAGIRVPSALTLFNFYMEPYYFPGGGNIPQIIPTDPKGLQLVTGMMAQWTDCTTTKKNCPQSALYQPVNKAFVESYGQYINNCTPPSYLTPETLDPPAPTLYAFLRYVHGWVPFNTAAPGTTCNTSPLPTAGQPPNQNGVAPIDYIALQYNYLHADATGQQVFNPYTQLVHVSPSTTQPGLDSNAYAFSIDDAEGVQNNAGQGLIFAVGGCGPGGVTNCNGLPNTNKIPPALPNYYGYYTFAVGLGTPTGAGQWASYGICSTVATTPFPNTTGGYAFGVNPALYPTFTPAKPCTVTLMDTKSKTYQFQILMAGIPPNPIWPPFNPMGHTPPFDKAVISCPQAVGVVGPSAWCNGINEVANPVPQPPVYTLSTPGPL